MVYIYYVTCTEHRSTMWELMLEKNHSMIHIVMTLTSTVSRPCKCILGTVTVATTSRVPTSPLTAASSRRRTTGSQSM